jgi:hypothetical protein
MSTAEQLETNEEEFDILDVPDEEIDKYLSQMEVENSNSNSETIEEDTEEEESSSTEQDTEDDDSENTEDSNTDSGEEEEVEDTPVQTSMFDGESEDLSDKEAELSAEKTKVDYKNEYQKLLAPFKANGKEMQVDNVDDARTLMQMGANYNKKMAALKPNLKIVKMLEKHNLLDEEKLSFLIDLSKQNPDAINKLIKDSGVDPLDLDTEQASNYRPNSYTVNDKEVELDSILDEIRDTEAFNTTANIIGTKWDERSKQVLVDNPGLIKVINDHVEVGIFDKISAVVERERMLGRLNGLSDIEAYKHVGDAINAQGGFQSISKPTNVKATNTVDPSLNKRKKAASSTKSTKTSTKVDDNFNPLSMSDEEFEKIASSKFI